MGTQLTVTGAATYPPTPEILGPEVVPVRDYDQHLQESARSLRISTMRIAYYGHRMQMCEGWTQLGFEAGPRGEEAYRDFLKIPRSTWYRAIRIGQAFHQLKLEDLERLSLANAEILLSVNPSLWHDYNWMYEARTMEANALALLVTSRNASIGDKREPLQSMMFKVPVTARSAIDRMLESFQKRHELTSKSQALELIVADGYDRSNLLAACGQALKLVEATLAQLTRAKERRFKLAEEINWLRLAMEVLNEAHEKAIQTARQDAKSVQDDGGRA